MKPMTLTFQTNFNNQTTFYKEKESVVGMPFWVNLTKWIDFIEGFHW